jgi:23S rRNA (guanosine2251-2'-O)-methyltransferase
MLKMNSKQLRKTKPVENQAKDIKRNPIYLVLDNVIDTYNIGSMFRLADAIAAEKLYICGESEYPPNSRIHKAAVGTEEWVDWSKVNKTSEAIKELKEKGVQIVCVEQDSRSIPYSLLPINLRFPTAIVVGHETTGVSKEVLDLADIIIEIPMFGVNKSLNVWGTAAIIAYKTIESLIMHPYKPRKKSI